MPIPTEQIGSIPRSPELLNAMRAHAAGQISGEQLQAAQDAALRDTISRLEATGSLVISDGEPLSLTISSQTLPYYRITASVCVFVRGEGRKSIETSSISRPLHTKHSLKIVSVGQSKTES